MAKVINSTENNGNLVFEDNIIPNLEYKNFNYYLNKVNDTSIFNKICVELDVSQMTKNYFKDFDNKVKGFINREKDKYKRNKADNFFDDNMLFNIKDIFNYLIVLGCPFVEKVKQDKFRTFLTGTDKSILKEYVSMIKSINFPYTDADKDSGNMIIIEFENIEQAQLVKKAIDGKLLLKNNKLTVLSVEEYLQLESFNAIEQKLAESKDWETSQLEEHYLVKSDSELKLYSFHYLKKQITPLGEPLSLNPNHSFEWSKNGTLLVENTGYSLIFYICTNSISKAFELPESCSKFDISPNERNIVTFSGLGNTNLITDIEYISSLITRQNIFIWDLQTRELIKSVKLGHDESFQNFKWSHDSKYLARLKGDILIIYETPDFKMLYDSTVNKRHPLTDKVTSYEWFPQRNYIMTIFEKRLHRNIDTTLNFYYVPDRVQCQYSVPLRNIQVVMKKWHPNGKILMLLLKTVNSPEWSVLILEFNFKEFTHKSKSIDIVKPVIRTNNNEEFLTENDIDYTELTCDWMDNGNEIIVFAKKRLLIPRYSIYEKKYIYSDEGFSTSLFNYSFNLKDLKITPWPLDKQKRGLRYISSLVSTSGKNFILYNNLTDAKNIYGDAALFTIEKSEIHEVKKITFGDKFSRASFDQSGRFLCLEINKQKNEKDDTFYKIFYISGDLIAEDKQSGYMEFTWRPRHLPIAPNKLNTISQEKKKEIIKELETEDMEFLSDFEKQKRKVYDEKKNKIYEVINKRRQKWKDSEEERKKLFAGIDTSEVEFKITMEETTNTEVEGVDN